MKPSADTSDWKSLWAFVPLRQLLSRQKPPLTEPGVKLYYHWHVLQCFFYSLSYMSATRNRQNLGRHQRLLPVHSWAVSRDITVTIYHHSHSFCFLSSQPQQENLQHCFRKVGHSPVCLLLCVIYREGHSLVLCVCLCIIQPVLHVFALCVDIRTQRTHSKIRDCFLISRLPDELCSNSQLITNWHLEGNNLIWNQVWCRIIYLWVGKGSGHQLF